MEIAQLGEHRGIVNRMKKYSCKHCGVEFAVKQKLGGHSRTCKNNPRYEESMKQLEVARSAIERKDAAQKTVKCKICDKAYSTTGMNLHMWKVHGAGQDNDPNAGYKDGTRQIWSKGLTKETDHRIARISQKISVIMTGRSRPDLKKNRDLSILSDYRYECSFRFSLKDYPDEFDFSLVEKHGWYCAKNRGDNLNGVSRDHIVSVSFGFKNGIDPKIISHPANCQLLRHNDNVSKHKKCGLTIAELLVKISQWDDKYKSMGT